MILYHYSKRYPILSYSTAVLYSLIFTRVLHVRLPCSLFDLCNYYFQGDP